MGKLLNIYEAAALLAISPELLSYCTSNSVKTNDTRKLNFAKEDDGILYFDEDELKLYDAYLRDVWPCPPKSSRPYLPKAFKNEVKIEASGECALCYTNGNSCEAAHIAAASKSKCNHPHNLIWLCANHHTKFDKGLIGPKDDLNEFVKSQKYVLQFRRQLTWRQVGDVTSNVATILKLSRTTAEAVKKSAKTNIRVAQDVAQNILALIPSIISLNSDARLEPVLSKVKAAVGKIDSDDRVDDSLANRLSAVGSLETEFLLEAGLKNCPLCDGSRWHNSEECPVCQGDGVISKNENPELGPFERLDCRLCSGTGKFRGETCRLCDGERKIERRVDERTDWSWFEYVPCPLCAGTGCRQGEDCSLCGGEKEVSRHVLENSDLEEFEKVDCPLCHGHGRYQGETCPACQGDCHMERRQAQEIDVSQYDDEDCKLCDGTGDLDGDTCPWCHGDRRIPASVNAQLEAGARKLVRCPKCDGEGQLEDEHCPACDGRGKTRQFFASRIWD